VRRKAVVLLSGGMDSATAAFVARQEGYEVHALSFEYGQRMPRELDAARAVANALGAAAHVVVPLGLSAWGGSSLTDAALPIPAEAAAPDAIPTTYVPARNMVFFSCAVSFAEAIGAEAIYSGYITGYPDYPDARPEFFVALEDLIRVGTRAGVKGQAVRIETPLLFLTKGDIVALGRRLGLDFGLTWSCYQGGTTPCGSCDACRLRAEGFRQAGIPDPLLGASG
jgi:7-cyano-7-deazaguanine synthase